MLILLIFSFLSRGADFYVRFCKLEIKIICIKSEAFIFALEYKRMNHMKKMYLLKEKFNDRICDLPTTVKTSGSKDGRVTARKAKTNGSGDGPVIKIVQIIVVKESRVYGRHFDVTYVVIAYVKVDVMTVQTYS